MRHRKTCPQTTHDSQKSFRNLRGKKGAGFTQQTKTGTSRGYERPPCPAQYEQRLRGLRIVAETLKAGTHLLFDNKNYKAAHDSNQQVLHIQGRLRGRYRHEKRTKGDKTTERRITKKAESLFYHKGFPLQKIGPWLIPVRLLDYRIGGWSSATEKINACPQAYPGVPLRSTCCTPSPRRGTLRSGYWRQKPSARHDMRHSISPYTKRPW